MQLNLTCACHVFHFSVWISHCYDKAAGGSHAAQCGLIFHWAPYSQNVCAPLPSTPGWPFLFWPAVTVNRGLTMAENPWMKLWKTRPKKDLTIFTNGVQPSLSIKAPLGLPENTSTVTHWWSTWPRYLTAVCKHVGTQVTVDVCFWEATCVLKASSSAGTETKHCPSSWADRSPSPLCLQASVRDVTPSEVAASAMLRRTKTM